MGAATEAGTRGRPGSTEAVARVLFLGGNGHCEARLDPARTALAELGSAVELVDAGYAGFEGRPRAADLDAFLEPIAERAEALSPALVYATGIGGLLALALRSRGGLEAPLVLQGAVLWGLEQRTFPRLMRGPMPALLRLALRTPVARARFRSRHLRDVDPGLHAAFFEGYARCAAFADFFRWLRAPLLRELEDRFRAHPERLDGIEAWWGERDDVVGLDELERTEAALCVRVPVKRFGDWAHYPMLEDPRGWSEELERALA